MIGRWILRVNDRWLVGSSSYISMYRYVYHSAWYISLSSSKDDREREREREIIDPCQKEHINRREEIVR